MLEEPFKHGIVEPESQCSRQITLMELFFATTSIAMGIGVFQYVSEFFAVFVGGTVIVYGVTRAWPPFNPVIGGVRGFAAASLIGWALFVLGFGDGISRTSFIIFLPPLGYILGYFQSELTRLPSLRDPNSL